MVRRHRRCIGRLGLASLVVGVAPGAFAKTITIKGQVGFIGEWALSSSLDPSGAPASGQANYSGALTMRHVGLCSANGPEEQKGQMTAAVQNDTVSRLTLAYGTQRCDYARPEAPGTRTFLRCNNGAVQVPIRVWIAP